MSLTRALLARAGAARDALAALPGLEDRLAALVAAARAAWPAVSLGEEIFMGHLAEKLGDEPEPARALDDLFAADLYLACACAHGDAAALESFEGQFMHRAAARIARAAGDAQPEDLAQLLRMRLLTSEGGLRPRIAEYGGRAPLAVWVRVVATRFAIDTSRGRKQPGGAEPAETMRAPAPDPELAYLKAHHRQDLEAAFRETLATLPSKTANVLRLFYIDGVATESIARLYRTSVRTAQRWISEARQLVLDETQRRLAERLRLSATEVDALVGLVQSQIDVSIFRFLEDAKK